MNSFFVEATKNFLAKKFGKLVISNETSVETDNQETQFFELIENASEKSGVPKTEIFFELGQHLAAPILDNLEIRKDTSFFDLLLKSEIILKKSGYLGQARDNLSVRTIKINNKRIEVIYRSGRDIPDFALGLITGAAKYCQQTLIKADLSKLADGSYLIICKIP
jgi:hypothetical protein